MIPEIKARQILEEVGIQSLPIQPFTLADTLDIKINELDLGNLCDGFLLVDGTDSLIGINSKIRSQERKNFTCAHELGHYCMDIKPGVVNKIECKSNEVGAYNKTIPLMEVRANKFAGELLLPKNLVHSEILDRELSWSSIDEIANLGAVSRTVAARRFIELTDEACAFVVSTSGQISWYASSPSFGLRIDTMSRILTTDSMAGQIFKGQSGEMDFVDVPAWAWISDHNIKGNIQEFSLPLNSYGQVLSLIWDDQGLGDMEDEEANNKKAADDFDPRYGWETPTFHKKRRR